MISVIHIEKDRKTMPVMCCYIDNLLERSYESNVAVIFKNPNCSSQDFLVKSFVTE